MMTKTLSPEQLAETLVLTGCREHGGPCFINLKALTGQPVALGPYENPASAHEDAVRLKAFLVEVIRELKQTT